MHEIKFTVSEDDLLALIRVVRKAQWKRIVWAFAFPMIMLTVMVAFAFTPEGQQHISSSLWGWVVMVVLSVFVLVQLIWSLLPGVILKNSLKPEDMSRVIGVGEHCMAISAEGLKSSNSLGESSWRWHAITKIESTTTLGIFWFTANQAGILPRRAFASSEDFEAFMNTARSFSQAAKSAIKV